MRRASNSQSVQGIRKPVPWGEYLFSISVVGICSVISVLFRSRLDLANFTIVYLMGVLVVSIRCSRRPALVNALLSVVAFNYFCVPTVNSFAIADSDYVITLLGMLAVALVTSTLTLKIRQQAAEALEREQQTKELYRLREQAEAEVQNERTRNALLSAVSHDIKTPLASIYGAATSLLEEEARLDASDKRDLVGTIADEAERLNRVVTNLLEMTRLEAGQQPVRDWYPLEEIIGTAVTSLDKTLRGRAVTIDISPDLPLIWVDGVLLEQVFVNLLENVAKYTPQGTPIRITARTNSDRVAVTVEDHGPGFSAGDETHVFDKFFRGKVQGIRGVGLGLAICNAIIERHQGTITATNAASGGAVIAFELPIGGVSPELTTTSEGLLRD